MKTRKTSFKKIISALLCCSLVLELGWSLNGLDLNAADVGSGVITVSSTTVTLSTQGTMGANFTITANGSGYKITCDNPYDAASSEKTISNITILQCVNEGNVNIETDLRSALVLSSEYSNVIIKSGYTFNCTAFSGTKGVVENYGTWSLPAFSSAASGDSMFRIFNYGTISASTIDISDTTLLTHDGGSEYIATTSFTKGSDNYDGLVVAGSSNTSIVSSGGSFKLKLGSDVQNLSGAVNDTAGNLVLPTLVVGLDTSGLPGFSGTPLYYGQIYDFTRGITTDPSGYASQGHIEYANRSSDSFTTAQPTYPGYYDARAVVPDVTGYNGSSSGTYGFRIQFLPYTELFSDDNAYVTVSGAVNGKYVPDKLTLTAPSGMEIAFPTLPGFSRFSSSVSLSKDDLYLDGNLNADLGIAFRRTSDNATTDERSLSLVVAGLSEYVFDTDEPIFDSRVVDSEGVFREVSIEDGGNIVGNEIRIIVSDENLASVTVEDKTDRTMDDLSSSISNGSCVITISGMIGESHTYKITAVDMANKITTAEFTLYHEPVDPTLTVTLPETIYVGDTYEPVIRTNSDGIKTVNYTYTEQDLITSAPPTQAGSYGIIVSVSGTDYYNEASYSDSFTIYKNPGSASVSAEDITIGGTVTPVLTTTSDGKNDAVFEYKAAGAADSTYTTTVPTAAGTYTVRATIPETDKYLSISCTADFKINKKAAEASVSVADITVGGTVTPVLTTTSDGKSDAVFEYKSSDAPDSAYSAAVPSAAGTYMVRVTVPETAVYQAVTTSGTFKINLNQATLVLTVDDIYYGQKPDPSYSTNSDGAVVIMYKSSDAADSTYTTVAPTNVGNYVARATVRETGTYARKSVTTEFKISFLDAPKTAYTLSGTEGNNGFFTSDVELIAPDGYLISDSLGGEYAESIPYSGELNAVYLKRISDGALTSSVAIGETDRPKIDKEAPVFNTSSGSIADGSVVYVSKLDVIANDPNLRSLTVNGKPVDLSAAGNILSLDPGYGYIEYTIVAEDEAGNITTFKFILMAEWRREGILPPDVVLPLFVEETYKLDTGTWTVNDDATVYNGGMPVYVNEDGDYTFTKVS